MTVRVTRQVVSTIENAPDAMESTTITVVEIEAPLGEVVSVDSVLPRSVSLTSEVE